MGLKVLSLFDGMSCGQIALRELGIEVDAYYAFEIDKFCIAQTQLNFPDTIQLGDVRGVNVNKLPKIDLLLAGSPCQGFSYAGKHLNFDDPRSKLFFEFQRILYMADYLNPELKFLLENVRMKKSSEEVISQSLDGLRPVVINSALVSAQNRVRLYWSNIRTAPYGLFGVKTDIPQPKDRGIFLRDVLEDDVDAKYNMSEKTLQNLMLHKKRNKEFGNGFGIDIRRPYQKSCSLKTQGHGVSDVVAIVDRKGRLKPNQSKASCFTVGGHGAGNHSDMDILIVQRPRGANKGGVFTEKSPTLSVSAWPQNNWLVAPDETVRRFTPTECARLQTIPEWYKWECSATQQYRMLGNGWTVEVIKHILSFLEI